MGKVIGDAPSGLSGLGVEIRTKRFIEAVPFLLPFLGHPIFEVIHSSSASLLLVEFDTPFKFTRPFIHSSILASRSLVRYLEHCNIP
jgi:hypothetical protein